MNQLVVFILLLPLTVVAQLPLSPFRNLGVNEGLSQNSVYVVTQDRSGYIWIGTGDGLNRFDGKKFKIYRPKEGDSSGRALPGTIINSSIIEDRLERLWFTTNTGLVVFDKRRDKFFSVKDSVKARIRWSESFLPVTFSQDDQLWGLVSSYGIASVDIHTYAVKLYPLKNCPPFSIFSAAYSNGKIWITSGHRLMTFDPHLKQFEDVIESDRIEKICLLSDQRLLVSGENRISVFDPSGKTLTEIPVMNNKPHTKWYTISTGSKDYAFAASESLDLVRINLKDLSYTILSNAARQLTKGVAQGFYNYLFIDQTKNLWIGTEGSGLYILDLKPRKFRSFPENADDGKNMMVKAVFNDDRNNILIGTYSQGLYVLDATSLKARRIQNQSPLTSVPAPVFFIRRDSSGRIWMNSGDRIGFLDTTTFRFRESVLLPYENPGNRQHLIPYSFFEIRKDHYLIGTNSGIYQISVSAGKILPAERFESTLSLSGFIYAIGKAEDGSLYIGKTRGGFWRLRQHGGNMEVIDSAFMNKGVRDFYFSKRPNLVWIATDEGLVAYYPEQKRYEIYDESDGMSNHYIYGILGQNDHSLWLSTNKGINHAQVNYRDDNTVRGIKFTSYSHTDGLQSNEFNSGAFFKSTSGEMLFGGINGINWFHPDSVVKNFYPARPVITSILCNDKKIENANVPEYIRSITLPYNQNTLTFEFAALEFTNPAANKFSYRLEGLEDDWIDAGTNNLVKYANLKPGNYTLRLRVSNNDDIWNDQPLELGIHILPPFWSTWWFRSLAVLLMLFMTIVVTKIYAQRKLKIQIVRLRYQQALNQERERISREMHDDIGAGLTHITLISEAAKRHAGKTERDRLDEISLTGRKLIRNVSDIVWSLNPEENSLPKLVAYLREKLNQMLEYSGMEYEFHLPEAIPDIHLSSQKRRNILMICTEIVNNSIKYSEAHKLTVSAHFDLKGVSFRICDDGKGFDIKKVKKGNGLNNIKKRITELKGTLQIDAQPGRGSAFAFVVPLAFPTT